MEVLNSGTAVHAITDPGKYNCSRESASKYSRSSSSSQPWSLPLGCLLRSSPPPPLPFRPTHHHHRHNHHHHSLFHHRGYLRARERLVDRHFYVDVVRVVIILDVVFFFLFSAVLVLRLLSIDWFPRTMGHGGAPRPSLNRGENWCRVAQWAKVAVTSGKCGESL